MKSFQTFLNESTLLNVNDLKRLYRQFNQKFFQNKLPLIPITVSKQLKHSTAVTHAQLRKKGGKYVELIPNSLSLVFNGNFEMPDDFLIGVLLHEMIHVSFYVEDLSQFPRESHGSQFLNKLYQLERLSGYKIPVTDSVSQISSAAKQKRVGVIVLRPKDQSAGRPAFILVRLEAWAKRQSEIRQYIERLDTKWTADLFVSDTILHLRFSVQRDFSRSAQKVWRLEPD